MIEQISKNMKLEGYTDIADAIIRRDEEAFSPILRRNKDGIDFVAIPDDEIKEARIQWLFRAYGKVLLVPAVRGHVAFRAKFMPRAAASRLQRKIVARLQCECVELLSRFAEAAQ